MTEITHRSIETNGIRMHIAEAGPGPLVLLHSFPERRKTHDGDQPSFH